MTRLRVLIVVVAAIVAGAIFVPSGDADASTGAISGVVSAENGGQPVPGVAVTLEEAPQQPGGDSTLINPGVCTAGDGSYTVPNLSSGSYTVYLTPSPSGCGSGAADYGDAQVSTTVTAPNTTTGVDAALPTAGAISGAVTDAANGAPLADQTVEVTATSGGSRTTCTDEEGQYVAAGLTPGDYDVEVQPQVCSGDSNGFASQWYPGAASQSSAQPISVSAGSTTTGIDAALQEDPNSDAGLITGTVDNDVTGQPAANVEVEVDSGSPGPFGHSGEATDQTVCTNASGAYALSGLLSGSYAVTFDPNGPGPCGGEEFLPDVYNQIGPNFTQTGPMAAITDATQVSVSAGQATGGIGASLAPGATISGTVTDAGTGQPASQTLVEVYDPAGNVLGSACTQANGAYTTTLLPGGSYRVGVASDPDLSAICLAGHNAYLPDYYPSQSSLATAQVLTLTAPTNLTGIDAQLVRGASITGSVTLPGSVNLNGPGDEVAVIDAAGDVVQVGLVFQYGTYTVGGLSPGSYTVRFSASGFATQYYAATPVESAATPITLASGETVPGIDATLVPVGQIGTVTGTVTNATTRKPIAGVVIGVAKPGGPLEGTATSRADGTYTVSDVPAGSYDVVFLDSSGHYLPEFSDDSATLAAATPVAVSGAGTVTGVNAALVQQTTRMSAALISPATVTSTRTLSFQLACPGTAACAGQLGLDPSSAGHLSHPRAIHAITLGRILTALGSVLGQGRAPGASTAQSQRFSVRTGRITTLRFRLSPAETRRLLEMHHASVVISLRQGHRTRTFSASVRFGNTRRSPRTPLAQRAGRSQAASIRARDERSARFRASLGT